MVVVSGLRVKAIYRKNLKMTEGKIAAQVAHAVKGLRVTDDACTIVVLGVSDKKFNELINSHSCYICTDAGRTEVPTGTQTAAAWIESYAPHSIEIDFITESNMIEGIHRPPTQEEIDCHFELIQKEKITLLDLVHFVRVYQPNAELRIHDWLNVTVGSHVPPRGGVAIGYQLETILEEANKLESPFKVHIAYEALHPFTDGNGRSGRALWAWMMMQMHGGCPISFLHQFYYQTLQNVAK